MLNDKIRLHLANGTVYLKNYINIDVALPEAYLAIDRPDLVELNKTTFDNYYKDIVTRDIFLGKTLQHKANVCDIFSDIRDLPFEKGTIDEILAVQVFEHFSFIEGKEVLKYWITLLKKGGYIHLDVPDLDGTIDIYNEDKEWGTRLLYGSQKNEYGVHKAMYTKETSKKLFEELGLSEIIFWQNMHTYPAFGIMGRKI
jgi:SAM-dependent methyltransferase